MADRSIQIDLNAPVHLADLPSFARKAFAWWVGELNAMLPAMVRGAVPQSPEVATLYVGDSIWRVASSGQSLDSFAVDPSQDDKGVADQILAAAPNFSLSRLVVVLPAPQVLRRQIELPLVHERQLLSAVELQVDRLTPFKSETVRLGVRPIARDAVEGKVTVECAFAPRAVVDALEQRLHGLGFKVERFDVGDEAGLPAGFDLVVPGENVAQAASIWIKVALSAGVVFCWYLAGLMWSSARENELEVWQSRIDEMRPRAMRSVNLRQRLDGLTQPFDIARRHQGGGVLFILQELTTVIPDTARLTEFEFNGSTVKIAGVAQEASTLIGRLEASTLFKEVRFLSQVMRQPETNKDRFEITLKLEGDGK